VGDVAAAPEAVPAERAEEVLHRLLAGLPPRDRLVLTLIYLEGASVAQAAELTGWSRTMVKVQAHRARAKLRRLVDRVLSEGW
jgi:RNA polymerase sigma-70 factor (ECF subfamily)